jgi:toxin ParE1/3/4
MIFKVIYSNVSIIDLEKIVEYYYKLNQSTAKKYYIGIQNLIKKLKDFPHIGRIIPEFEEEFYDKYRELIYENYRIIYKIIEIEIIIVRIIDGRRLLEKEMIE